MIRPTKIPCHRPSSSARQQRIGVPYEGCASARGAAALEFVIVLPVFMMIVLGAADWGRVIHVDNVLMNAARSGAAYGTTHRVTDYIRSDWESRVVACVAEEAAHLPDFHPDLLNASVATFDEPDGSTRISVNVSYPFEMVIDWPGWPGQITLSRTVSMRGYR